VSALPAGDREPVGSRSAAEWAQIAPAAPQLAATMRRYLGQLATFLAPASVEVADIVLHQFACWLLAATSVTAAAGISRDDIEDFKLWLAARPGGAAGRLSASTYRQRLRTLRMFFERIIEAGLARRPAPQPRHRRRHPAPPRPVAQVPRATRTPRRSWPPPGPPPTPATALSWNCSPVPACGPAN
jgi:hypothetical protein